MPAPYDAFLLISFGGPEKREDVIPFLENVLRGRNVPRERLLAVAEHYYHFDGVSPINEQNRQFLRALNLPMPVYWGNRNWHPMLTDTVRRMSKDGVGRVLALATSAFGSYSGCRQYREDIEQARQAVPGAPEIDKLPPFWDNPGFIASVQARVEDALRELPGADVVYTAHSIPLAMSQASPYERQLREVCTRVNTALGLGEPTLVYQSRSGPPSQPWLGPDVCDYIRETSAKKLIAMPVGFLSDHMEVLYDLDTEAVEAAAERGIEFVRAKTPGTHPLFVQSIREMLLDAMTNGIPRNCAPDCCKR